MRRGVAQKEGIVRAGGETPPVALARATLPALAREEGGT